MTSTCNFSKCAIAKRLKIKKVEECPNHISTWWTQNEGKPVLLEDCAPQRTMLMVQDLHNRLIGVQESQEQQRNVLKPLNDLIASHGNYPDPDRLPREPCLDTKPSQSTT